MSKLTIKFPSIGAFRHAIETVQNKTRYAGRDENNQPVFNNKPLPTLKFRGTVKLHGTNAGITFDSPSSYFFQSKETIITPKEDNYGFARHMVEQVTRSKLIVLHDIIQAEYSLSYPFTVFGEWAGKGIQSKVAISEIPKFFVIFGIASGDNENKTFVDLNLIAKDLHIEESAIYNILQFPTYEMYIDFNNPKIASTQLVKLTEAVERECPVAKVLGVTGMGEGIVWNCIDDDCTFANKITFKVKGEKHSVKKEKTVAEVDVEKVKDATEFVEATVTEHRLEQGLDHLRQHSITIDIKATGNFVKWIYNDVVKEESDTMEASGLVKRDVSHLISNHAKAWFFTKLDEMVGL